MSSAPIGTIHHVELWVPDIDRAAAQWGWLLTELGYQPFQEWTGGCSWRLADTYIVIEQSPDMLAEPHDRKRPGLNHLAFHAGDQAQVDALTAAAAENGWALMFADKHPHAGGPQTYAAYLSNTDGHEVELTASNPVKLTHPQVLTIPQAWYPRGEPKPERLDAYRQPQDAARTAKQGSWLTLFSPWALKAARRPTQAFPPMLRRKGLAPGDAQQPSIPLTIDPPVRPSRLQRDRQGLLRRVSRQGSQQAAMHDALSREGRLPGIRAGQR